MGLGEWFNNFCSNIQVQDGSTISTRYKAITQRLNTDFWNTTSDTSHSLYVGSYGRNTAIQGFSGLDMIFQLPYSIYEQYNGYSEMINQHLFKQLRHQLRRLIQKRAFGETDRLFWFRSQMGSPLKLCRHL